MVGSGEMLTDISSAPMIVVAAEVLSGITIVGVGVIIVLTDVGRLVEAASMEEGGSTISLSVGEGINDVATVCKELSDTVGVSAVVVIAAEIVGCGVGVTVFSIVVAVRELSEPDAVVVGMLIESKGMLLVVERVWAKVSMLETCVNVTIGDDGMGVALLTEEVRFTVSKVSIAVDTDTVGLGNVIVSVETKLVVVRGKGGIVVLIMDEICPIL